jgi:GAF domain-containing protein
MPADELLRQLARVADEVGPALEPAGHEELLQSIVAAARRLFGAAASSMALLDEAEENLIFVVADGTSSETVVGLSFPATQGIAGFVVRSGQPLAIEDVRRDPRFAADFAEETGYRPTSILAVPLETERGVLGVLEILDRSEEAGARGQEMEIVGLFAQQAALAIENSRVFRDLGRTLLRALSLAAGTEDHDLTEALDAAAEDRRIVDPEMAELAEIFAELGQMGPEERKFATRLTVDFLTYARAARRFA